MKLVTSFLLHVQAQITYFRETSTTTMKNGLVPLSTSAANEAGINLKAFAIANDLHELVTSSTRIPNRQGAVLPLLWV